MESVLLPMMRSRWFSGCVHAALWLLLYLVLMHVDGRAPKFGDAAVFTAPAPSVVPVSKLDALFKPAQWANLADTNAPNPFYTRHFVPPPSPAPPPPPTTRKVEVTYEGFFQTSGGPKHVLVKLGDAFVSARLGASLTTNLYVLDATLQRLTLTNSAAQTNLLLLNTKKEIEVPLK